MNNSEQNPQSCQTDFSDSRFQSAYAQYWDKVKDIIDEEGWVYTKKGKNIKTMKNILVKDENMINENKIQSEEVKHFHKKDQPSKEIFYPSIIEVSGIDFEEHIKWEDSPNNPLVKKRVCIGKIEDKYMCIKSKESELENIMLKLGKNSLSWLTCGSVSGLVLEFWAHGRNIIKERTFNQWVKQYMNKIEKYTDDLKLRGIEFEKVKLTVPTINKKIEFVITKHEHQNRYTWCVDNVEEYEKIDKWVYSKEGNELLLKSLNKKS